MHTLAVYFTPRHHGTTQQLLDHYTACVTQSATAIWRERNLDLRPVPMINSDTVHDYLDRNYHGRKPSRKKSHLLQWDQALEEALQADQILIVAPIYNFSLPTPVKAWFDTIAQRGTSWQRTDAGYEGLMGQRSITLLTSAAMDLTDPDLASFNQVEPWFRAMSQFLGFRSVNYILADAQADPKLGPTRRQQALEQITSLTLSDKLLRAS